MNQKNGNSIIATVPNNKDVIQINKSKDNGILLKVREF
jgi:hypothetical protein